MLANKAVTAVRQRVTRELLDRRGRKSRPGVGQPPSAAARPGAAVRAALARMWNGWSTTTRPGRSCPRGSRRRNSARCARPPPAAGTATRSATALGVLPLVRRRGHPRAHHARGDDRDLVAGDRGVPHDRAHERPDRGHEQVDQAGETRRLRVPEPGELPAPGTVALHPADPPIVSEETDGARPKLKSRFTAPRFPDVRRAGCWSDRTDPPPNGVWNAHRGRAGSGVASQPCTPNVHQRPLVG